MEDRFTLHPLAQQFAGVAEEYERGRPEYPPAAVGALAAELRLVPGARTLDLAAGTGKLTRALRGHGLDVVAVEPLAELRAVLERQFGPERVRAGVAEAIPLPDDSVDAVTVADAFHWFDHAMALAEIRRVLRPGGGLAVLNTIPDWGGASWAHELGQLVARLRPEHPHFDGPPWAESLRAAPGWSDIREVRVTADRTSDAGQIVDHLASMSWVAAIEQDERAAVLDTFRRLIDGGEMPSRLPVHYAITLSQPEF